MATVLEVQDSRLSIAMSRLPPAVEDFGLVLPVMGLLAHFLAAVWEEALGNQPFFVSA